MNVVKAVKSFILGGNAEFTIKNTVSGNEYKYRVTKREYDGKDVYFIKVKASTYEYAGCIKPIGNGMFKYYKGKGNLSIDAPAIKGIIYAISKGDNPLPSPMALIHHGKCARCGKRLDDEQSIERGFGPSCWKKIGGLA